MTTNLISIHQSVHHSQVEWPAICQHIARQAYFERNKSKLTTELYVGRLEELTAEFVRTETYLTLLKDEDRQLLSQVLGGLPADDSLQKFLSHISKSGSLNFAELNKVALLIESAMYLKTEFDTSKVPEFQQLAAEDFQPLQRKFLKEFRYLVETDGELHLDRHPELQEHSRRLRELEERIRRSIQEWINNPQNQKCLQYNSYDVHYDRYVVPVRSDSYRSELGLIVSRSESGSTLFVEPFEVRDACNRRLELIAKIDEIINQLAQKFSFALAGFSGQLPTFLELIQTIDFYAAKSGFALEFRLNSPMIRQTPGFRLNQLFHPLLKNPVKNSVDCHSNHHGIVISGPNTGGKTVFLKSLTLAYLLFYHGYFVPAAEAELYPYDGLFYFGNDLQDLKTGLSSFSGEVKNYIDLLENILPTNLILIDEIFNSTSSDEASALSLAYFDELHERAQCHVVVSTHHQMFKTLVHQDRNYLSCHVGFDTKNMKPTYKIMWGTPGASMAIDIFRILSRDHEDLKEVSDRALSRMNTKNISYETLLQKVSQKQIELDQLLNSNRQLEVELRNQKGAMEGVLNLRMNEELRRARQEVEKIVQEARELVEEARRNEIQKVKRVDERSHQLTSRIDKLRGHEDVVETLTESNLTTEDLKPGDLVHSIPLKKEFTVQSIDVRKNEVVIGKGPIKFTVPVSSLVLSKGSKRPQVSVSFQKTRQASFEHDVRGMRLSEFQNLVDSALGDLLTGDVPYLSIIHGHGDGVLKNWLRDYLKKSKDFQAQAPENGNDGETRIILR